MKRAITLAFIVLSVIVLDQVTKRLIMTDLKLYDSIEVLPFLHIVSVRNTGAAFGSMKGMGSWFFIAVAIVAIAFVIYLLIKRHYNSFGLTLVLGGAIGNLIDRILYGKVVDFIDFSIGNFHWPAFNVADSALTVGIILIFAVSMIGAKQCQ